MVLLENIFLIEKIFFLEISHVSCEKIFFQMSFS